MNELLFIFLQDMNPSKGAFGLPYDSTQGFSVKGQLIFLLMIIAFILYVGLKVWRSLRNETKNRK